MLRKGEDKHRKGKEDLGGRFKSVFIVKLTPQAEKAYLHLDPTTRARVDRVLERFERGEFQHPNIRALKGELAGSLRYRLGKWRIVFRIDYEQSVVWIEAITTRSGAYR